MSMLLLQTFLLMLTAFFLGALVACLIKSTFYDAVPVGKIEREPVTADAVPAGMPRTTGTIVPEYQPRPAPGPVQPMIETVDRPAAAPEVPVPDAKRFERALKEQTSPPSDVPISVPGPAPQVTPKAEAPKIETPKAEAPKAEVPKAEPPKVEAPAVAAPKVELPNVAVTQPAPLVAAAEPRPSSAAEVAAGAVIAAAAAMATSQVRVTPVESKVEAKPAPAPEAKDSAAAPLKVVYPAAGSSTGSASVTADVSMQPEPARAAAEPAPLPVQDLTRIRAIDPVLQARLYAYGVRRFEHVAGLSAADVSRLSSALGIGDRVGAENWIEQAQILSRGGETAFSLGRTDAAVPLATPTADEGKPAPITPVVDKTTRASTVDAPPTAAAPLPGQDLTRIRSIDVDIQERLYAYGIRRYDQIANLTTADIARLTSTLQLGERLGAENWIEQAAILAKGGETAYTLRRMAVASAPAPAPSAPAPGAVPATLPPRSTPGTYTSLDMPAGTAVEEKPTPAAVSAPAGFELPRSGAQAAAAAAAAIAAAAAASSRARGAPLAQAADTRDDLQRISGINAEVENQLNMQGVTRFGHIASWTAADTDRFNQLLGTPGRVTRENWIEQASILAKGGETEFARRAVNPPPAARQEREEPAAPRPTRIADAIRQNAGRETDDAARTPIQRVDRSNLRSVRSEALRGDLSTAAGGVDDLKRIRGIGVLIEKKLNSLGISSYEQMANWTGSDVERVSQILDFKGRIERENWVEQARILASGGQTEFSRRLDRGGET